MQADVIEWTVALDYLKLASEFPTFQRYVRQGARGGWIDYKDPKATKELARTLLRALYGLQYWSIPDGYAGVQHFGLLPLPITAIG